MNAATPLKLVFSGPVLRHSLLVALIVGTVLNLINQGDRMFVDGSVDVVKAALTFIVPFCVSSYGAYSAARSFAPS